MTAFVRGISVDGRGGSIDKDLKTEYSVIYKVYTDDRRDGPAIVRTAFGIPDIGDIYTPGNDYDPAAVVVDKSVRQGDSPYEWEVEVSYSNDVEKDPATTDENPLNQPTEYSFGFQNRKIIIPGYYTDPGVPTADFSWEKGVYAPNGEEFNPQPEVDIGEPVLRVKLNMPIIVFADLMAYTNMVNSDRWNGCSPRQLQFQSPTVVTKYHKSVGKYWECEFTLAYRFDTWDIQVLNQGTYYWTGGAPADPLGIR